MTTKRARVPGAYLEKNRELLAELKHVRATYGELHKAASDVVTHAQFHQQQSRIALRALKTLSDITR